MSNNGVTIDFAFLCDDLRVENNGKQIFIGVYSDEVNLSAFPMQLELKLILHFKSKDIGSHKIHIAAFAEEAKIMEADGNFQVTKVGGGFAGFPLILSFDKPSALKIVAKIDDARKKTILTAKIGKK